MTTTRRLSLAYLALTVGVAVLFALNLFWGSVSLTPGAVAAALLPTPSPAPSSWACPAAQSWQWP